MPLIRDGRLVDDTFRTIAEDAPLPENGTIVSFARFQRHRASLVARNVPLGVLLQSHESPEPLGDDVHRLSVVALEFPRFRDGRAFSWARILRGRMDYAGEIRAVGHYLYDQIAFMHRVGFDSFEVPEHFSLAQYLRALGEMSQVYQPSTDRRVTIRDLRARLSPAA